MAVTLVQTDYVGADGASSVIVTPASPWAPGNLLVAVATARGTSNPMNTPSGWTNVPDAFLTASFDGGVSKMMYRVVEAGDSSFTWTKVATGAAGVVVAEFHGVGAYVDRETSASSPETASSTMAAGPLAVPAGEHLVVAAFIQATRDGGPAGGLPLDYDWDGDYTEITDEADGGISHSGPAHTVAYKVISGASPTEEVECTAAESKSYGWMLAAFAVAVDPAPPPLPSGGAIDTDEDGFDEEDMLPLGHIRSWRITRGSPAEITGAASIGQMVLTLLNDPLHGNDRYNPLNESGELYGKLKPGVPVHLSVNADGALVGNDPRGLFGGRIRSISPKALPGETIPSFVELVCDDALARYGRTRASVPPFVFRTHRQMREAILDAMGETRRDLAREAHSMPLSSWDGKGLAGLEALNGATLSRHFVKPSDTPADWYRYTVRNRQWRLDGTVDESIDAATVHLLTDGWTLTDDTRINQQRATVTPVTFTAANVEVWAAEVLPFVVKTGKPWVRWVEFDDYVRDPFVDANSTGSALTVDLEPFGDRAKLTLTSAGTTTVKRLSIEGRLARRMPAESAVEPESVTGEVREGGDLSSPFIGVIAQAQGLAGYVVWRHGDAHYRPTLTVTNWFPEMFEVDLFDVLSLTIAQIGLDAMRFEIVGLTHEGHWAHAAGAAYHRTVFVLEQHPIQTDTPGWFVVGSSLIGGDDVLAP